MRRHDAHEPRLTTRLTPEDLDPLETGEWLEALDAVVREDGPERAQQLIEAVVDRARELGAPVEAGLSTPYTNTISVDRQEPLPGDGAVERRLRSILRWNAIAMVLRANKDSSELGGHIASYQSIATLYETGFNHFWRAPSDGSRRRPRLPPGPLVDRRLRARVPRGTAHAPSSSTGSAARSRARAA